MILLNLSHSQLLGLSHNSWGIPIFYIFYVSTYAANFSSVWFLTPPSLLDCFHPNFFEFPTMFPTFYSLLFSYACSIFSIKYDTVKDRKQKLVLSKSSYWRYLINYLHELSTTFRVCLICVFKQQFSIFLETHMGKKMCKNTYNIV